ncbi:MAG: carbonic anhydrase [Actinocatenispora sp.]
MTATRPGTPAQALDLLLEGNRRFVAGEPRHPNQDAEDRNSLAAEQHPFAVLFGCSDSRLAAEIIFDCGLGDLFVIRTAGHVVGPEVLGSIEYGVQILGVPLIAVLGHDSCGAVAAARTAAVDGTMPDGYIRDVVERVVPSVLSVPDGRTDPDAAGEAHVRYTCGLLAERSKIIAERVADGSCAVVGLSYRLAEGNARLLTGPVG